ncbi:MAG: insulinase family protein, partial [Proteobacteria bacterium]|nr:insulinase family protein [Pseudomonadota bacterium]
GDLNAYTSYDQTVLHATVEASAWEQALDILVDMACHSTIDQVEFDREKQVVLEEIRSSQDDPDSVLSEALAQHLFPVHPYGRPILGTYDSVEKLRRQDMVRFWRTHYAPNRALLGVAGAMSEDAVLSASKRYLGNWDHRGATRQIDPPQASPPGLVVVDRDFETTTVELNWPVPAAQHADFAALDLLVATLGQGQGSLLTQALQREHRVASDIWTSLWARRLGALVTVRFLPREGTTVDATALALKTIDDACRHGVSGDIIDRTRSGVLADFLFASETTDGVAHDMLWYTARFGEPEARWRYRNALAAVTAEDIARVARKWLGTENCTVGMICRDVKQDVLQDRISAIRQRPRRRQSKEPVRRVFDNGATVWAVPNELPVTAIHIVALGGGLAEQEGTAGTTTAWSRMITTGAGQMDATTYAHATDALAGMISGTGGRSTMGLQATFPAATLRPGMALVGTTLNEPRFSTNEWNRVREEIREELRTLNDRPSEFAHRQLWRRLWPNHPWRL